MKQCHFILSICAVSSLCFLSQAYADACPSADTDYIHCVKVTGLSNNQNEGRWIKWSNPKARSYVMCVHNYFFYVSTQKDGPKAFGTNNDDFSICTDSEGKNCQHVTTDAYTVSKEGDQYTANPRSFYLDLSEVRGKYPRCPEKIKPVNHTFK